MQRCSKKAYAMCPTRHLCGPIEEATFSDDSECATFNREVEDKPMTNADRIRAMSDEELADVVVCPYTGNWDLCRDDCKKCRLEWLRQPVEGV